MARGQENEARNTATPLRVPRKWRLKTTSARDVSGLSVPVLMRSAMAWKSGIGGSIKDFQNGGKCR